MFSEFFIFNLTKFGTNTVLFLKKSFQSVKFKKYIILVRLNVE